MAPDGTYCGGNRAHLVVKIINRSSSSCEDFIRSCTDREEIDGPRAGLPNVAVRRAGRAGGRESATADDDDDDDDDESRRRPRTGRCVAVRATRSSGRRRRRGPLRGAPARGASLLPLLGVRRTESVLVRASLARRGVRSDGGGACRRPYARTVNFPREDRQFSVRSVLTRCVFSRGLPAKSFARHSDHGKLTVLKTQSLAESATGAS